MSNEENIKKWIAALRSGKYEQTTGQLRAPDAPNSYCCLGVACEVYREDTDQGEWDKDENGFAFTFYDNAAPSYDSSEVELPKRVCEWLGIMTGDPLFELSKSGAEYGATHCNDTLKLGFNEIADAIERTFLSH